MSLAAWARAMIMIASLFGLFASVYLLYTYISGAPIACGSGSGCELVRASKWAYTFGVPRPFLGIVFYLSLMVFLIVRCATERYHVWLYRLTVFAAGIGFLESAFLFLVQWLDVKAFCIWCLTSAAAATTILIASFFDRDQHSSRQKELRFYFWSLLIALPLMLIGLYLLISS